MSEGHGVNIDSQLMSWLADHRTPPVTSACLRLMWLGTTLPGLGLGAALVLVWCLWRRRPAVIVAVGASTMVATVVAIVLKNCIHRARPAAEFALVNADGYSMPSTAAAMSAAALVPLVALGLSSRSRQRILWAMAGAQLLVVFALLYLGAHWLSDTVAGTVLGGVVGGIALNLASRRYADRPTIRRSR